MDGKRIVIGTIVSAVVLYALGFLIFNIILEGFYGANVSGAFRESQVQWATIVGNIGSAALLTLGILSRGGAPTVGNGLVAGAVVGFLLWLTADFIYYGLADLWTLTIVIVDPIVEAIHFAITGAVVAFVLAKVSPKAA